MPMPRKTHENTCLACGKSFTTTGKTGRRVYCSPECGISRINATRKIVLTREQVEDAIATSENYLEMARKLRVSHYTMRRRMKDLGIPMPKKAPILRKDGYWNYAMAHNHRRIMENDLGRPLTRTEQVHHIDGDKGHNAPSNLVCVPGVSEHQKVHQSLQEIGYELFRQGRITFNRDTLRYELAADFP